MPRCRQWSKKSNVMAWGSVGAGARHGGRLVQQRQACSAPGRQQHSPCSSAVAGFPQHLARQRHATIPPLVTCLQQAHAAIEAAAADVLHKGIWSLELARVALRVGHKGQSGGGGERDLCGV